MEVYTKFFSAMIFISALLGLMELSDIVVLCSRPKLLSTKPLMFWYAFIILRFVFMKE